MNENNLDYEEYIFAYIDILGFKNLISQKLSKDLCNIFNIFEKYRIHIAVKNKELSDGKNLNLKIASDSICIYQKTNTDCPLLSVVALCSYYQYSLLTNFDEPIFIRGGISKGNLFDGKEKLKTEQNKNDILFGNALINSYELESKEANNPRIIFTKSMFDEFENEFKDWPKELIYSDKDEFLCVNPCAFFYTNLNSKTEREEGKLEKLKDKISKLLESETNGHIREKQLYIKELIKEELKK